MSRIPLQTVIGRPSSGGWAVADGVEEGSSGVAMWRYVLKVKAHVVEGEEIDVDSPVRDE